MSTLEELQDVVDANQEATFMAIEDLQKELLSLRLEMANIHKTIGTRLEEFKVNVPKSTTGGELERVTNIFLLALTGKKIEAIKEIRAIYGLGLKEAKDHVEWFTSQVDSQNMHINRQKYAVPLPASPNIGRILGSQNVSPVSGGRSQSSGRHLEEDDDDTDYPGPS